MILGSNGISLRQGRKVLAKKYMKDNRLPVNYHLEKNGPDLFLMYMLYITSITEDELKKFIAESDLKSGKQQ